VRVRLGSRVWPLLASQKGRPEEILEAGKLIARALAGAYTGDASLSLARSFCSAVIETFWFAIQADALVAWPLPDLSFSCSNTLLNESAASLAAAMGHAAARMGPIEASYRIGVTYTAMLPEETRSRLGVYYTPPALTQRLLDMSTAAGVDWGSCRVLDPACGGGAFLAPVAAKMVAENNQLSARELVDAIAARVRSFEIDPFAAWASQVFLEATVMQVCRMAGKRLPCVVGICNSLLCDHDEVFDLVIGNPPYGRVTLKPEVRNRYRRGLYGHANLYGLFTDLAVHLTGPGGVIAYVTPTSFLANVQIGRTIFDLRVMFGEVIDFAPEKVVVEQRVQVTMSWPEAKIFSEFLAAKRMQEMGRTGSWF
jgi:adenine-specific DNA-methyltransferase